MNPRDPMENGTIGGTGPLNIDAACKRYDVPMLNRVCVCFTIKKEQTDVTLPIEQYHHHQEL